MDALVIVFWNKEDQYFVQILTFPEYQLRSEYKLEEPVHFLNCFEEKVLLKSGAKFYLFKVVEWRLILMHKQEACSSCIFAQLLTPTEILILKVEKKELILTFSDLYFQQKSILVISRGYFEALSESEDRAFSCI